LNAGAAIEPAHFVKGTTASYRFAVQSTRALFILLASNRTIGAGAPENYDTLLFTTTTVLDAFTVNVARAGLRGRVLFSAILTGD
jgi:hypothetical protein